MPHTYTLTPQTATGGTDAWNNPIVGPGTPVPSKPCRFVADDRVVVETTGTTLVGVPTLTVPHDDPIKEGDSVSTVRDLDLVALIEGEGVVDFVQHAAGLGRTLKKVAVLRTGASTRGLP
jgi:hypothetical protein